MYIYIYIYIYIHIHTQVTYNSFFFFLLSLWFFPQNYSPFFAILGFFCDEARLWLIKTEIEVKKKNLRIDKFLGLSIFILFFFLQLEEDLFLNISMTDEWPIQGAYL